MIFSGKFRNDKGAPFTRGSPEGGHPGGGIPMGRIPQIVSWAALAAAGFISFRGVFRASLLGFRIVGDSNSELAKYEQAVGDVVSGWMLLAFGLVVFGAALSFFLRRKHGLAANATAVVLAAASIVLTVDLHFVYVYDPPATVSILLERIKEVRPEDLA